MDPLQRLQEKRSLRGRKQRFELINVSSFSYSVVSEVVVWKGKYWPRRRDRRLVVCDNEGHHTKIYITPVDYRVDQSPVELSVSPNCKSREAKLYIPHISLQ